MTDTKRCPKCETTKPLEDFARNNSNRDGRQNYCKKCSVAAVTASRRKDPTSHRRSSKNWREKNLERHADNNARWRYGIEHGAYAAMLQEQNGVCAICKRESPGSGTKRFHIDHCHDTGKVRGLLCTSCNNGIGRFNHDISRLEAAALYLERAADIK
jgi:hypothetical protein